MQAADFVTHREIELTLCVGAESMSRNPVSRPAGSEQRFIREKSLNRGADADPAAHGVGSHRIGGSWDFPRPRTA